jgi:hypothetical protein
MSEMRTGPLPDSRARIKRARRAYLDFCDIMREPPPEPDHTVKSIE